VDAEACLGSRAGTGVFQNQILERAENGCGA